MSLRDDLKVWDPMYLWQTLNTPAGHVVTADEWNNYWNLLMTQGDHSSEAIKDMRDMLYETVLSDTNGATAVKFTHANFTATDVSAALIELDTQDITDRADYIARDAALATDYNGKFTATLNTIVSNESARNTRNTNDEQALATHKTSTDHDGRYNTKTEITNALALKADLASPTFTGTVGGITKAMVGLSNVDNTADSAKPISTLMQDALNLKATIASLNTHKISGDHDSRYAMLLNETPYTPIDDYNLASVDHVRQKISEAVLSGISDNSITDAKMAPGNKLADILAAIPDSAFDFDTPAGKAGWAYTHTSNATSDTEIYTLDAVTKASRVFTYDSPSAGQTTEVLTCPDGKVVTRIYTAETATITEV